MRIKKVIKFIIIMRRSRKTNIQILKIYRSQEQIIQKRLLRKKQLKNIKIIKKQRLQIVSTQDSLMIRTVQKTGSYIGYEDDIHNKNKESIMSVQSKQLMMNKGLNKKEYKIRKEDWRYVQQNGELILNFLQQKRKLVKTIQNNLKAERIINLIQKQNFNETLSQIQQQLQFAQKEILQPFTISSNQTNHFNSIIYSFLLKITQINENMFTEFQSFQYQNLFPLHNQSITKTEEYNSPSAKRFSKRSYQDISTNNLSHFNSNKDKSVKRFQLNCILAEEQYDIIDKNKNMNLYLDFQNSESDSLDQVDKLQKTDFPIIYQNDSQSLQEYFLSFIISLSATEPINNSFLIDILNQIGFSDEINFSNYTQIQNSMIKDNSACMKILILIVKNKFDRILINDKNQSSQLITYFPNSISFLKMVKKFIEVNLTQIYSKIKQFLQKSYQISQIFIKINSVKEQTLYNQIDGQDIINSLSNYLPKDFQQSQTNNIREFTFSPKTLLQLKNNILQSCNLKQNKHAIVSSLKIFQKVVMKIIFNRISRCKRYNYEALQKMVLILQKSKSLAKIKNESFRDMIIYTQQEKEKEKLGDFLHKKYSNRILKMIINKWKEIKVKRIRLLRVLMKKRIKKDRKQANLLFNIWRINTSRYRIEEKMLVHSQSCNSVINKFARKEMQIFENNKKRNVKQRNNGLNSMSRISMRKENSFKTLETSKDNKIQLTKLQKESSKITKDSNITRSKIILNKREVERKDFKLLNYKYKEEILSRINKSTKNNSHLSSNDRAQFCNAKTVYVKN